MKAGHGQFIGFGGFGKRIGGPFHSFIQPIRRLRAIPPWAKSPRDITVARQRGGENVPMLGRAHEPEPGSQPVRRNPGMAIQQAGEPVFCFRVIVIGGAAQPRQRLGRVGRYTHPGQPGFAHPTLAGRISAAGGALIKRQCPFRIACGTGPGAIQVPEPHFRLGKSLVCCPLVMCDGRGGIGLSL